MESLCCALFVPKKTVWDAEKNRTYLEANLCQRLWEMCHYNTGGDFMDFPLRKAFLSQLFSSDVSNMVLNDSSFGTPTTSLAMHVCHFPDFIIRAFPEIQPNVFLFSDFKKDSISSLSCQLGNPTVNSSEFDCDIRVSNGNPTFHSWDPILPLIQDLRIMHIFSRPHRGAITGANSSGTPNCLWGWQPTRTVCQEPPQNLITFPRPCF